MDNKELQVIQLGSGDSIGFQKLITVFQEVFEMENRPVINEAYLRRLLENPGIIIFAIQYKNEIVGGLTAYELPLYYSEYSEIFIYDIAIKPGFQRKGFGTMLLSALKDYCRDNGIKEFFVEATKRINMQYIFISQPAASQKKWFNLILK
jgi:aminoglycoside 3-N-acetyltransferase I